MAGHLGNVTVTVQSLKVCAIDKERCYYRLKERFRAKGSVSLARLLRSKEGTMVVDSIGGRWRGGARRFRDRIRRLQRISCPSVGSCISCRIAVWHQGTKTRSEVSGKQSPAAEGQDEPVPVPPEARFMHGRRHVCRASRSYVQKLNKKMYRAG